MAEHTHTDDRLTFACPGCIADAEEARWTNAPLRTVAWYCSYIVNRPRTLAFTLTVKVPNGATHHDIDERYLDATGEAFVLALPEDVPMNSTVEAMETMEVERLEVGTPITDDPAYEQERML